MDSNESALGCSPRVVEALQAVTSEQISCYPEVCELKTQIAVHNDVSPKNILITSGADDAIRSIFDTFLEPEDRVILPVPTFSLFEILASIRGASITTVLYQEDFSFPTDRVLNTLTGDPALIIIVSPNNPTGTCINEDQLHNILNNAPDCLVLLDETYHHFTDGSFVGLISEYDNLIVLHSFSKAYGLAGIRLGVIFSSPPLISSIQKVVMPYPVSSLAVIAGCAALEDQEYLIYAVNSIITERQFLASELEKINVPVCMTDTNFLLMHLGDEIQWISQELRKFNILIRQLTTYPLLSDYARITVRTRSENVLLIEALKSILPPEALLFDMDGVLVEVSESYIRAIKETAEQILGESIKREEIQQYKEKGGFNNDWDLTEAIIRSRGVSVEKKSIIDTFQKIYRGTQWNGVIQNEQWILDQAIIRQLHEKYPLGIVTGRPREEALYALDRFGMKKYFPVVVTLEDVPREEKPHPRGIQKALDALKAKRALYVGDTIDDVRAARAAGIVPVVITSSDAPAVLEPLLEAGAVYLIPSVNDIVEVLP
jgi:histidinol-phosphate aminotransferase